MRRVKKALKWTALLALLLLVLAGAWLVSLAHTRRPHWDGTVPHPSLTKPVQVIRDDWGVPHIHAENEPDACFALGYVMAQDRLFQMEALRRLAQGELAEILGPLAAPLDAVIRSFQIRRHAEETIAAELNQYPELLRAAQAFLEGLNHAMNTEPLPLEFTLLGIRPRPFTLIDSLTVAAILPITFAEGLRGDALYSQLQEKLPNVDLAPLFAGYSREIPITIMESLEEAKAYREAHPAPPIAAPPAQEAALASPALNRFFACLRPLHDMLGPHLGSNSWVLAGARTKSGKPILANDPHIGFTNPSVWYEAHVQYGDNDLYGHYLPLIPLPLLGQNRNFAWALTMFENDDVDLYRETFHPANPAKVMYKGQWADIQEVTETIRVRFGKERRHTVRVTPHGPVITDLFKRMDGYHGADIALSWVWQKVPYTDLLGLYRMAHARDCDSFAQGVALMTSPGLNISYADRAGNIAWWAAGKIPIRPPHVNHKQLLDGASGQDEILGYLPFEQNPQLRNPAWGYIVTANNMSTIKPMGAMEQLQGYWQPSDRAARIEQILEHGGPWDLDEMRAVQFDDTSTAAAEMTPVILELLSPARAPMRPIEQRALDALARWDYRHNVESIGASIFQVFCEALSKRMLLDEMGATLFRGYSSLADHWNFMKFAIHEPNLPFWDNTDTPARESRDDIFRGSFTETAEILAQQCGEEITQWTWGAIHTMEFKHPFGYLPLLGRIFNVGPFPASGAAEVVNNMLYMAGEYDFDVIAGPSMRRLIDFADPDHSLLVLPTGNSGNFMSPHYGDQAPLFMKGEYREPRLTSDQIEAHKRHVLNFTP